MISLLPPSPASSQIDTTFLRSKPDEHRDADQPRFDVVDRTKRERQEKRIDDSDRREHANDLEAKSSEEKESTSDDKVQSLLELIAQQEPRKKPIHAEIIPDGKATEASDLIEEKSTTDASALVALGSLLMQVATDETSTSQISTSSSEKQPEQSTVSLKPMLAVSSAEMPLASSSGPASQVADSTVSAATPKNVSSQDNAIPVTPELTRPTAEPKVKPAQLSDLTAVELSADVPADIPIEIVSQTPTPAVSAPSSELKTAFQSAPPMTAQFAAMPEERDELTRQIEQMIARESSPASSANSISTDSALAVSQATVFDPVPVLPPESGTTVPDTTTLFESQSEVAPAPASFTSAGARDQADSEFSQSNRDNQSLQRTEANGAPSPSAAGWSQATSSGSDLASMIRSEVREPLSSQAARAILNHIETRRSAETETLTVRLDPPELGEMTIELSKTREGLAVRVTARESVTMDMLLARGQEIEQHLKMQNVDVASMEFFSSGASERQSSGQNANRNSQDSADGTLARQATQSGRSRVRQSSTGISSSASGNGSQSTLSFHA